MQSTMTLEACCRCGQPIAPGAPAMHTASVDIVEGRAVTGDETARPSTMSTDAVCMAGAPGAMGCPHRPCTRHPWTSSRDGPSRPR